jgi:hypothetical protein
MRAVDVGVGHDDDLLVAQVLLVEMRAGAAAERLDEIGELRVLRQLVLATWSTCPVIDVGCQKVITIQKLSSWLVTKFKELKCGNRNSWC